MVSPTEKGLPESERPLLATRRLASILAWGVQRPLVGITVAWRGEGISEEGVDTATNKVVVQISEKYFRPTEVETLLGDCSKAKKASMLLYNRADQKTL